MTNYVLGHETEELRRLEEQGRVLAPPTDAILTFAGIRPGMRVLDLGTGAGDVALAIAARVGPTGSVVAIDRSRDALDVARQRCAAAAFENVTFRCDDLVSADLEGDFDAVVGRLVLLYVDDPTAVVRRYAARLRPGGVFVAMEFEMSAAGALPSQPFADRVVGWIVEAFRRVGHDPILGARLGSVLTAAGLVEPVVIGLQSYLASDDPAGPRMAASIVRSLLPVIERHGIASAEEVDVDSLERRIVDLQQHSDAMFKPPTLVGAWARASRSADGAE